jgi:hypothetical protein
MPDWFDYQKLAVAFYDDLAYAAVVTHNDKILRRGRSMTAMLVA